MQSLLLQYGEIGNRVGANELLFWLSANRNGSWANFRSAAEELMVQVDAPANSPERLPFYQRIRFNLQQLGHVEFGATGCEGGWRVAPPVIALSDWNGRTAGIVCGARLPVLVELLEESHSEAEFERQKNLEQPDIIRFFTTNTALLQTLSEKTRSCLQPYASVSLLSCLPRVTDLLAWHSQPCELPFGKLTTVGRFDLRKTNCRWIESSVEEARRTQEGLFRFTRFQRREHYMRLGGRTIRLQGQIGTYFLAARRHTHLLRYDRVTRELTVPDVFRPPLLVDRALVLCSGFVPHHNTKGRTLTYVDIPEGIAGMVAGILCQEHL